MKKSFALFLSIFLFLFFFSCSGGSSGSSTKIKKNLPIFYSNPGVKGIIETASIDISNEKYIQQAINPFTMKPIINPLTNKPKTYDLTNHIAIDKRVKKIGDYFTKKGYIIPVTPYLSLTMSDGSKFSMGVPIIATSTTKDYSYASWYTKPTDYSGTRIIEIIDKNFYNEIVKINEDAVYAFPFKILTFISSYENKKYLHICILDIVDYLKNFIDSPSDELIEKFIQEENKILSDLKNSLDNETNITFFNEKNSENASSDKPSIIKIATVLNQNIDNFTNNFLKIGDILVTLNNGSKVRYIAHNPNDPNFPYDYSPDYLNNLQTEITGIVSFCRFILPTKNIWLSFMPDNYTINYPSMLMLMPLMSADDYNAPKSEPMEFLIKNSMSHIYARYYPDNLTEEKYIKFEYKTSDNRTIYQLSIFDPYISTALLATGEWHKPFLILNVYIKEEKDGTIGVYIKNPEYLIEKYFSDISDNFIAAMQTTWDSYKSSMFYWPNMNKKEMGEFSKNKLEKLIKNSLDAMGVIYKLYGLY